MQIFVKPGSHSVFDGVFYYVGSKPRAYALSKARHAASIISRMAR
jgi:hypothetical protein